MATYTKAEQELLDEKAKAYKKPNLKKTHSSILRKQTAEEYEKEEKKAEAAARKSGILKNADELFKNVKRATQEEIQEAREEYKRSGAFPADEPDTEEDPGDESGE